MDNTEHEPTVTSMEVRRIDRPEQKDLPHLVGLLDAVETDRLSRFRKQDDRRRYLAAHAGLRILLGERLGLAPRAVRLGRATCPLCGAEHGRPISLDDPNGTHFSIAHSAGLVLLTIADGTVGIDVEPIGGPDLRTDLDWTLHPADREAIDALPAKDRSTALLSRWVRAEAYLKALGTGLGLDPATVEVGLAGPEGSLTVLVGWTVADLDVGPGHVAAVAVAGGVAGEPLVESMTLPGPDDQER